MSTDTRARRPTEYDRGDPDQFSDYGRSFGHRTAATPATGTPEAPGRRPLSKF
jgi:hypothetical protein